MFAQAPPPEPPAAVQAAGPAAASPADGLIADPQWVRRPTAENVNQVFPIGSYAEWPVMRASAICTVTAKGLLTDCVVTSEAPEGRGIGAGLINLSRFYRMKLTADGQPVVGRRVGIAYRLARSPHDHN